MTGKILHLRKLLLFVGLSLADLVLTWLLVRRSDGMVYEGNPVAGWWLDHHGWLGLAGFKGGIVLLVAVLTLLISRYRPRSGGLLLGFACSVLAGVLVYSVTLAGLVKGSEGSELSAIAEAEQQLAKQLDQSSEYRCLMDQLAEDLVAGRCSLAEAVDRVGCSPKGQDPDWIRQLHICFPDQTDAECLASNLIVYTVASRRDNPSAARQLEQRLNDEFRSAYGVPFLHPRETHPAVTSSNTTKEFRPAAPPDSFRPHGPKRQLPMPLSAP